MEALSAAYMILGLKYGSTDFDDRMKLLKKIKKLNELFYGKMKAKNCKELLSMEILEDDNMKLAEEKGLFESVCTKSIKTTIEILEELL